MSKAKSKTELIGRTVSFKDHAENPALAEAGLNPGDTLQLEAGQKISDLTPDEIAAAHVIPVQTEEERLEDIVDSPEAQQQQADFKELQEEEDAERNAKKEKIEAHGGTPEPQLKDAKVVMTEKGTETHATDQKSAKADAKK